MHKKTISILIIVTFLSANTGYAVAVSKAETFNLRVPIAAKYNQQRIEEAIKESAGKGGVGKGSVFGLLNTMVRLGVKAGDSITVLAIQEERKKAKA